MRTADDFNSFYAAPDPWRIANARFRDQALRRAVAKYVAGKTVLELGCGEGHLSATVLRDARSIHGIDISDVAIARARSIGLSNARFDCSDFLSRPFAGHDVIAAIECIYYLSPAEQAAFFEKVAREHRGILIMSGPIIGQDSHRRYFTHEGVIEAFERHGIAPIEHHNVTVDFRSLPRRVLALTVRLLPLNQAIDYLPDRLVFQRCYIARAR